LSYWHVRQPLNRTIARDIRLLILFDKGVTPKRIAYRLRRENITPFIVYQAIERRTRFPSLYLEFHGKQSYESLRTPSLEKQDSNGKLEMR
jgi:hypothetical protein